MGILLSSIIKEAGESEHICVVSDVEFDVFSRATSITNLRKCIFISNEQYLRNIDSNVSAVITTPVIAEKIAQSNVGICIVDEPRGAFFKLMETYDTTLYQQERKTIIGKKCRISKTAIIAENNVVIGDNVVIEDYAVVYENTVLHNGVHICAHCTVGIQDFNIYEYRGIRKQAYHAGRTELCENVLLGSNSTIGRALYCDGLTRLGRNVMTSVHAGLGHNCIIGDDVIIEGNVGINGFVNIGNKAMIHSGVIIKNGLSIGDNAEIDMGSVVIRDVKTGEKVFGNPAKRLLNPGMKR